MGNKSSKTGKPTPSEDLQEYLRIRKGAEGLGTGFFSSPEGEEILLIVERDPDPLGTLTRMFDIDFYPRAYLEWVELERKMGEAVGARSGAGSESRTGSEARTGGMSHFGSA